jgi:hypothetical protein
MTPEEFLEKRLNALPEIYEKLELEFCKGELNHQIEKVLFPYIKEHYEKIGWKVLERIDLITHISCVFQPILKSNRNSIK